MHRLEKLYLTMGSEFLTSTVHDYKEPRERSSNNDLLLDIKNFSQLLFLENLTPKNGNNNNNNNNPSTPKLWRIKSKF